jgi:hypothetical protein
VIVPERIGPGSIDVYNVQPSSLNRCRVTDASRITTISACLVGQMSHAEAAVRTKTVPRAADH